MPQSEVLPHFAVTAGAAAAVAEFVFEEPFEVAAADAAPFLPALLSFRLDEAGEGDDSDSPLLPFSARLEGAESPCEPAAWPFEAAAVVEAADAVADCPLTRSSPRDSEWCSSPCELTGPE